MARTLHILRLDDEQPSWHRLEAGRLEPVADPGPRQRGTVIAVLPDVLFFYYHPQGLQEASPRQARAATRLQMNHTFPSLEKDQTKGVIQAPRNRVLGFFAAPGLQSFLREHHSLLASANIITTPFTACWVHAAENETPCFVWRGGHGLKALFAEGRLEYFQGDEEELAARLASLPKDSAAPETLLLEESLLSLVNHRTTPTALRMPIRLEAVTEASLKPLRKAFAVCMLIAIFLLSGQLLRQQTQQQKAQVWRNQLQELYASALGPDPGSDPYGKLLYTLDQLQSGQTRGVNVLGILSRLSTDAQDTLRIDTMNLSPDSGAITGRIGAYDALESYLNAVNNNPGYQFTLEQATNTETGIQFNLRVTMLR